jgi:hypothetical protein
MEEYVLKMTENISLEYDANILSCWTGHVLLSAPL